MGKKRPIVPEETFLLPPHPAFKTPNLGEPPAIIDTHTHLLATFSAYKGKYPNGKYQTVYDFVRGYYLNGTAEPFHPRVTDIVDVWCEAPVTKAWKELADSALTEQQRNSLWGGINYWFVIGVHPHEAKFYTDDTEKEILEAASHPRCVGMGEMGLDYHYDNSPRDIQKQVLIRQLKCAVKLGKAITIHTREADDDILPILKAHVPRDHKIHIHCFTDTPELAQSLLEHFPNLCIGITGVITYATNPNTSAVIRNLVQSESRLRIVLETDAPYMVPASLNSPTQLGLKSGQRLAFSHSGMIPWTAEFVASVADEAADTNEDSWGVGKVLQVAQENAKELYSI